MLNIENIKLKPYYGMGIKSYVDNYINSARKLSVKHKFKPDIFTVRTKNIELNEIIWIDLKQMKNFIIVIMIFDFDNYRYI